MTVFLGVDGGGSKTAFLVVDDTGAVLGEHVGPSTYYFAVGIERVEAVLAEGIGAVLAEAGVDGSAIDRAFFGLPGYGESSSDLALLDGLPHRILGHDRYRCDNDMVAGWAGSLGGEDGINVIGGTGSMTYGQRGSERCRVGGWGELFGDEGSAYWIAVQALNAFTRMSDQRLPIGPLHAIVVERLQLASDHDLISLLGEGKAASRTAIAALARSVSEAAAEGDSEAEAVLLRAGRELAALVIATRARLGYRPDDVTPVSYSGGVFSNPIVREAFAAGLASDAASYDLREPRLTPVAGAVLQAAREAGSPLNDEAIDRLAHSTSRAVTA